MSSEKSKILEVAQQYTIRGQIQKAIEEWKKLLTDTPNDANIYNTIGDLSLKNQSSNIAPEEAISYYLKAGEIFESSGFALKAIAVYKKILKVDPSRKEIYVRLGDLNYDRGLTGNAREDYLSAAKLYSQEGLVKEALGVYRKIADLDPNNLNVRTKIADIFLKEGLMQEAIEEYNKVAIAYLKANKREEAHDLYKLMLRLDPNNINALVEIGRVHLENGHIEEAIGYGKRAIEISSDSFEVLSLLVDSYNRARMYDEAEEIIVRIIEARPDQLTYRETLASILLNKGDSSRAAEEYITIGREYFGQQDFKKAHTYAEKASILAPDLIAAHEMLFEIYSNTSKKEESVGKGLFLARHFHESGDMERAQEYYLKILQEDPYNVEAKEGLERVTGASTFPTEKLETLEEAKDTTGKLASAEVYIKYGLLEKAAAELQEIVDNIEPDHEDAHVRLKEIYNTLGEQDKVIEECLALLRIYESAGDREKMETIIQEAIDINPDDGRIREYMDRLFKSSRVNISSKVNINEMLEEARFYVQQGMVEEAVTVYKKVLSIDPENEEALNQVEALTKMESNVPLPEVEIIQSGEEPSTSSFFDLEEALKKEVVEEPKRLTPDHVETPLARSFEEIFQEFHEGVKAQLGEEDYETHFNLGIAYKEMGLFQEAIEEFELCMHDTPRFLDALYMIAVSHKELGEYQQAIESLERAIASQQYNDQRHIALKYELGLLLEMTGKRDDALRVFTQIHDTDATYRDVSEKVLNLQRGA